MQGLKNKNGWWMQHHELYPLLGLTPGSHLPDQGFTTTVNGVYVVVKDKHTGNGVKSSKHRVYVQCSCDRMIPFGRIGQHIKGRQHAEWSAMRGIDT
jgi:hypothetical protein